MQSTWDIPRILGALVAVVANGLFWWRVVRGDARVREHVGRAFGVSIGTGSRGHWKVEGVGFFKALGIELLQLVYYLGAFVIWGAAMILVVFALGGIRR